MPTCQARRDHAQIKLLICTNRPHRYLADVGFPAVTNLTTRAGNGRWFRSRYCSVDSNLGGGPAECLGLNSRSSREHQSDENDNRD